MTPMPPWGFLVERGVSRRQFTCRPGPFTGFPAIEDGNECPVEQLPSYA